MSILYKTNDRGRIFNYFPKKSPADEFMELKINED